MSGGLAPYMGHLLVPGMGSPMYTAELDNAGLLQSIHDARWLFFAVVDGASRDAGNSPTTVLRPGLVMAKVTASGKYRPFAAGGSDGTEQPIGILYNIGLNTQLNASNADRLLATILVGGYVNPEAICIAASATYGLDKSTAAHVTVRKAFKYAFQFTDDPMSYTAEALSAR